MFNFNLFFFALLLPTLNLMINGNLYSQPVNKNQPLEQVIENLNLNTSMDLSNQNLATYNFSNIYSLQNLEELNLNNSSWGSQYHKSNENYYGYHNLVKFIEGGNFPNLKILTIDWPSNILLEIETYWYHDMSFYKTFFVRQSPTLDYFTFAPNLEVLSLKGFNFVNKIIRNNSLPGNNDMRDLGNLCYLKVLDLSSCSFETEQIEQTNYVTLNSLEKLSLDQSAVKNFNFLLFSPNLQFLSLSSTNVNGNDLGNISKLLNLNYLDLSHTKITAGSLKKMANMLSLNELKLGYTNMKSANFSHLPNSLRNLDLSGCEVSIGSFNTLSALTQLEKLDLRKLKNFNFTVEMFQNLQTALPNCSILY